jgi:predicted  nucleic acid-binding Zn-ribbon protein
MWKCLECGRRFRTARAAERAANNGCPHCGGVDIDLDVDERTQTERSEGDSVDERLKRIFLTRKPKSEEDKR